MSLENFDPQAALAAIIADDPDAAEFADSILAGLTQLKNRQYSVNPATVRQNANLSQNQFADALGISVNTLRSWEQGLRRPSGSARVLLNLLAKRPELIHEIAH